jgi:DNA polymerase/3'-5' exonuclease PolX
MHRTGRSKRLDDLLAQYGEETYPTTKGGKEKRKILDLFQSIPFIGHSKANKLYDAGYRSMEDLEEDKDNLLTHAQKVHVKYHEDLKKPIPKSEMKQWQSLLQTVFNNTPMDVESPIRSKNKGADHFRWIIAGSYLRGEPTSSDIDVIVMDKPVKDVVEMLGSGVVETIKEGKHIAAVIVKLNKKSPARMMDIIHATKEEFYYELLHWTGSASFTKLAQVRAHEEGYKILNEYGLFTEDGELVPASSEEDIFEALQIKYLEPMERHENLSQLQKLEKQGPKGHRITEGKKK